MRLNRATAFLLAAATTAPAVSAFVGPSQQLHPQSTSATTEGSYRLFSAVAKAPTTDSNVKDDDPNPAPAIKTGPLSATEIKARLVAQLEKLRQKDKTSPLLTKEVSE
jgi:hypothetical protein